jgi:hypothetical protein
VIRDSSRRRRRHSPSARFEFGYEPLNRAERALDAMPVGVAHAPHDRLVLFDPKFPSSEWCFTQDETALVSFVAELCRIHDGIPWSEERVLPILYFKLRLLHVNTV